MKRVYYLSLFSFTLIACGGENTEPTAAPPILGDTLYAKPAVSYPVTRTENVTDTYFGTLVEDPYRWLENDTSAETKTWVVEQNKTTNSYLEQIPFRNGFKKRLEEIYNYERSGAPAKVGEYYFYYKNDGLQNQSVIYVRKGLDGKENVFMDPNAMSSSGTVSIGLMGHSKDNKYIAWSRSDAGSDWQEIHITEIETGKELPDVMKWVKFSDATWYNDGFFYSRYPAPKKGMELSATNTFHSVYYHKLGDPQEKDVLIFEDRANPLRYHYVSLTEDDQYLVLYAASGTNGYECHYKATDLKKGGFTALFTGFENKSSIIDHKDGFFYVTTDIDAPTYRLVKIDPKNPAKENWKDIIPAGKDLLEGVSTGGGKLYAQFLKDVSTHVYQYDYSGKMEKEIEFPAPGTAGGFGCRKDEKEMFYTFTSFTYPTTVYRYDIESGKSEVFFKPNLKFNPDDFESKQVFYTSKDGTKIPMFIVHKKGMTPDGKRPTLLYAYGGFNVSLTPSFNVSLIPILENDGIYALANLRGGGEYGEEWHQAGMLGKKQNVFDDFIAAAEYLIKEGYTNSSKLGISGGSNGGLLVGACMTQRPDLYKVAFPAVGVLDMLRYHKFTVGFGWIPEYGSSEESEASFKNLFAYSPFHNIKEGTNYPATMVLTGDHDDRVVPAHSFKFAAMLQAKHKGDNPVLIRIETDAGHGAGKPTSKVIEETADKWAFFFFNTNSEVIYK
ncbi:MAG: prolyl oligopeptidase family serine peptidase [Flavobacteriales bacterium]